MNKAAAVAAMLVILLLAGCTTSRTPRTTTSAPSTGDHVLSRPLWDFSVSKDPCDPTIATTRNHVAGPLPGLAGTDLETAQGLAKAVGDSVRVDKGVRGEYGNVTTVSFGTVGGHVDVFDPDHVAPGARYTGRALRDTTFSTTLAILAALGATTDNATVTADGWVTVPMQGFNTSVRAVIRGAVPSATFTVQGWFEATGPANLGVAKAVQYARSFQDCWEKAHGVSARFRANATLTLAAWNGSLAYAVRVRDPAAGPVACDDVAAPVLVDAQTGWILGHQWTCYQLHDGKHVDATVRRDAVPYTCETTAVTVCTSTSTTAA